MNRGHITLAKKCQTLKRCLYAPNLRLCSRAFVFLNQVLVHNQLLNVCALSIKLFSKSDACIFVLVY